MNEDPSWWRPQRHAERRPRLLARNLIVAAVRAWFAARDFVEVDPAALQVSPGNEAHLHAFSTEMLATDGARRTLHLHTSPEFALKKLLAAGERRLVSLGHAFRNRERGALHHPEFTMAEWYRAGEPYEAVMADSVALLRLAAEIAGATRFAFRGRTCDPFAEPERLPMADAFQSLARIDLLATLGPDGRPAGAPPRAGLPVGRHPGGGRRHLVRHGEPGPGRAGGAPARDRPADPARPLPGGRGGARPPGAGRPPGWPSGSSSMSAGSSSPTASAS